jgi:hypothetical protein
VRLKKWSFRERKMECEDPERRKCTAINIPNNVLDRELGFLYKLLETKHPLPIFNI